MYRLNSAVVRCIPAGGAGAASPSFVSSELVEPDVTGTIEPVVGTEAIRSALLLGRSESITLIAGSSEPETIRDFVEAGASSAIRPIGQRLFERSAHQRGTRKGLQHVRIDRLPHEHVASAGSHVFFGDIRHRLSSRHGGGSAWLTSRSKPSTSR